MIIAHLIKFVKVSGEFKKVLSLDHNALEVDFFPMDFLSIGV